MTHGRWFTSPGLHLKPVNMHTCTQRHVSSGNSSSSNSGDERLRSIKRAFGGTQKWRWCRTDSKPSNIGQTAVAIGGFSERSVCRKSREGDHRHAVPAPRVSPTQPSFMELLGVSGIYLLPGTCGGGRPKHHTTRNVYATLALHACMHGGRQSLRPLCEVGLFTKRVGLSYPAGGRSTRESGRRSTHHKHGG